MWYRVLINSQLILTTTNFELRSFVTAATTTTNTNDERRRTTTTTTTNDDDDGGGGGGRTARLMDRMRTNDERRQ